MNFDLNQDMGLVEEDLRLQINRMRRLVNEVADARRQRGGRATPPTLDIFPQNPMHQTVAQEVPVQQTPYPMPLAGFVYATPRHLLMAPVLHGDA